MGLIIELDYYYVKYPTILNISEAAAGGSDDWVMGVGRVPLSYTIELPMGGYLGFNPPASRIEPIGIETFEAFKVFGKYVAYKYGSNS